MFYMLQVRDDILHFRVHVHFDIYFVIYIDSTHKFSSVMGLLLHTNEGLCTTMSTWLTY
jgi:hypothetical protein